MKTFKQYIIEHSKIQEAQWDFDASPFGGGGNTVSYPDPRDNSIIPPPSPVPNPGDRPPRRPPNPKPKPPQVEPKPAPRPPDEFIPTPNQPPVTYPRPTRKPVRPRPIDHEGNPLPWEGENPFDFPPVIPLIPFGTPSRNLGGRPAFGG